ncbi:conserved hypothetical protein [Methanocaldococcus vulcanius M7]|uniref:Uncharacterized protein n=1 Tax=Methanocaldococcus vulcanius (strain ATCC 700851 / DSM 12094 / M7) TaxID=579137 RepID=C9RF31_METVM|nr:hypothetical protein [Methanocaldococcus vulcanius]ACX72183.1 conserved hypothetical protein [Methanocaldococcus vulcanius M7]
MINNISNFDKVRAVAIAILFYIFIILVVDGSISSFIGDYITYPVDKDNLVKFYDFVYVIGFLLSLSISTWMFSKGIVKDFAKSFVIFFGIAFILGIGLFLVLTFLEKHIISMSGYTTLILFFFLLNLFEKLDKLNINKNNG